MLVQKVYFTHAVKGNETAVAEMDKNCSMLPSIDESKIMIHWINKKEKMLEKIFQKMSKY